MNDERLAELKEKYKDRNLLEELAWGAYFDHSGYTSKQNGEFLNWLCMTAYEALKERPQASNNAELFKQTFGMYATELWSMKEADFLKWLNAEVRGEI